MPDASPQRVTLMDVAKRAGVSRTTASFVTTGRTDMRISTDAQERVLRAARELGYRPSLLARSLRTNRSQTIGLISDGVAADAFAGEMIRGAVTSALLRRAPAVHRRDRSVTWRWRSGLIHNMVDRGVGGFVYASMYTKRMRVSAGMRSHPLVLVNCTTRGKTFPTVIPDEREAGRSAARRCCCGTATRDRIVLVGETPPHVMAAVERLAGITDVLQATGAGAGRIRRRPGGGRTRPSRRSATTSRRGIGRVPSSA